MRKRRTKQQKQKIAFFSGILFITIGFWMIFVSKDKLGFIPGIIGAILLAYRF